MLTWDSIQANAVAFSKRWKDGHNDKTKGDVPKTKGDVPCVLVEDTRYVPFCLAFVTFVISKQFW